MEEQRVLSGIQLLKKVSQLVLLEFWWDGGSQKAESPRQSCWDILKVRYYNSEEVPEREWHDYIWEGGEEEVGNEDDAIF